MTLPVPAAVRELFEDLLGRQVTVRPGEAVRAVDLHRQMLISTFVDDTLRLQAVVEMDLPLAAYAGAAIGRIPGGAAESCIKECKLTPMIAENVTEVCNVLAALLNREGLPHIRMYRTYLPGEPAPADVAGYLRGPGRRLDLGVDVHGYGIGRLAMTLAN